MEELIKGLKQIEKDLAEYVSPNNEQGFIKKFAFWVYSQWSQNPFYDTDIVDVGFDCSSHPEKTDELLSERCRTYAEFINANTGNTVCTHISGSGMRCEEYSENLREIYGDACSKKLDELIEFYKLEVPEKYKKHAENIREMIFFECVDHEEDSELYDVCDSILYRFNQTGMELEPYDCPLAAPPENGKNVYSDNLVFKDYTLDDFKKMVVIE